MKSKMRYKFSLNKNATPEELLESAKADKLITTNQEFRQLFIERVKRFFDDQDEAKVMYGKVVKFLRFRIDKRIPIKVDWFGTILSKHKKMSHRYDYTKHEYVDSEFYLILFVADKKFLKFFTNKENRQVLKDKIDRRIRAFIKKYGKIKIIGKD